MSRLDESTKHQVQEQLKSNIVEFLQQQTEQGTFESIETELDAQYFGDLVRWIKCLFKDCVTEDAKHDHDSAEKERAEKREEERKKEEDERRKQHEREQKEREEKQKQAQEQQEMETKKEELRVMEENKKHENKEEQIRMQNEMKSLREQISINKKSIAQLSQGQIINTKQIEVIKSDEPKQGQSKQSKAIELMHAENVHQDKPKTTIIKLSDKENQSLINSVGNLVAKQLVKNISLKEDQKQKAQQLIQEERLKADQKDKDADTQAKEIAKIVAQKSINEVAKKVEEKTQKELIEKQKVTPSQEHVPEPVKSVPVQIPESKAQKKIDNETKIKLKENLKKKLNQKKKEQEDQHETTHVEAIVDKLVTDDLKKEIKQTIDPLDEVAFQKRDSVDKTISSLLTPHKISLELGDLYVNTENTINLQKSVSNLSQKLGEKRRETKKLKEAQTALQSIQNDTSLVAQNGGESKANATFYSSFSKKMTDFLNSGNQDQVDQLHNELVSQDISKPVQEHKDKNTDDEMLGQSNQHLQIQNQQAEYPENISMMDSIRV